MRRMLVLLGLAGFLAAGTLLVVRRDRPLPQGARSVAAFQERIISGGLTIAACGALMMSVSALAWRGD